MNLVQALLDTLREIAPTFRITLTVGPDTGDAQFLFFSEPETISYSYVLYYHARRARLALSDVRFRIYCRPLVVELADPCGFDRLLEAIRDLEPAQCA